MLLFPTVFEVVSKINSRRILSCVCRSPPGGNARLIFLPIFTEKNDVGKNPLYFLKHSGRGNHISCYKFFSDKNECLYNKAVGLRMTHNIENCLMTSRSKRFLKRLSTSDITTLQNANHLIRAVDTRRSSVSNLGKRLCFSSESKQRNGLKMSKFHNRSFSTRNDANNSSTDDKPMELHNASQLNNTDKFDTMNTSTDSSFTQNTGSDNPVRKSPPDAAVSLNKTLISTDDVTSIPAHNISGDQKNDTASNGREYPSANDTSITKTKIRSKTRSAIESFPGVAVTVMQQQYYVPRRLALDYRAWKEQQQMRSKLDSRTTENVNNGLHICNRSIAYKKTQNARLARIRLLIPRSPPSLIISAPVSNSVNNNNFMNDLKSSNKKLGFLKETSIRQPPTSTENLTFPNASQSSVDENITLGRSLPDKKTQKDSKNEVSTQGAVFQDNVGSVISPKSKQKTQHNIIDSSESKADANKKPQAKRLETIGDSTLDAMELIRNYESVLQVVLSKGVVEYKEKKFLQDYRECCNIGYAAHIEALKRLGWSVNEYKEGSRLPQLGWQKLYKAWLDKCDTYGTYIVTAGSIASLTSIMMASMLHLRILQLFAGSLYFLFNITRRPPLASAAYWNLIFFAINSFMLLRLLVEHRPESFTEEELDIFEKFFLSAGLPPRQFRSLLRSATWSHFNAGDTIVGEGDTIDRVMFLYKGALSISANGTEVEVLEEGDRHAILGVKKLLNALEKVRPASAAPSVGTSITKINNATISNGSIFPVSPEVIENKVNGSTTVENSKDQSTDPSTINEIRLVANQKLSTETSVGTEKDQEINTTITSKASLETETGDRSNGAEEGSAKTKLIKAVSDSAQQSEGKAAINVPLETNGQPSISATQITNNKNDTHLLVLSPDSSATKGPLPNSAEIDNSRTKLFQSIVPDKATRALDHISETAVSETPPRDPFISLFKITAVRDCVLLVWSIENIVQRLSKDPVNLGFPVIGVLARALAARSHNQALKHGETSYSTLLEATLVGGEIQSSQKVILREYREKFNIPEETHWQLVEKYGWTREEYNDGVKRSIILQSLTRGFRTLFPSKSS